MFREGFRVEATVLLGGVPIQTDFYLLTQAARRLTVEQTEQVAVNRDIYIAERAAWMGRTPHCRFSVSPQGYTEVGFEQRSSAGGLRVKVEVHQQEAVIFRNGTLEAKVDLHRVAGLPDAAPILIDGDNPMFDLMTSTLLLGLQDGERREETVYRINTGGWRAVALERRTYTFQRTGSYITIDKGDAELNSAFRLTSDTSFAHHARIRFGMQSHCAGNTETIFKPANYTELLQTVSAN